MDLCYFQCSLHLAVVDGALSYLLQFCRSGIITYRSLFVSNYSFSKYIFIGCSDRYLVRDTTPICTLENTFHKTTILLICFVGPAYMCTANCTVEGSFQ